MKKTSKVAAIAAACVTAVSAVSGCAGSGGSGSASTTLKIGTMTLPQSLDPADAIGSALPFFQAVYDTLLKREPDGSFSPMLATEWSYNEDRTELTLTLRGDVKFDDGSAFDAAAVKANLERFAKGGGANAKTLKDVEEIVVQDGTHVVLKLSKPNPAMLYYLSDAAGLMANPASFAKGDALKTKPDGTGPYELDKGSTAIGTKWVYTRTDDYWGEELPYNKITMSYFDNETAIVNGIKTGQINAAVLQSADQQIAVESAPDVETTKQEFDFKSILLFDRGGKVTPALGETKVRQALNYAIDRKTMLDKIRQGRGQITSQVFSPESAAYDKALDSYYTYDPAKAKKLLEEAGYGDGFTLKLPRASSLVPDALASSLKTYFGDIGVELVWEDITAADIQKIFTERAYSGMVMNMGQVSNAWIPVEELIRPGMFNMFGTTDETVQELLPKIRGASVEDAKAHYQALNRHIVEEAWFLPFYRLSYLHVSDGSTKITPQAGMAVPSIYNYAPVK